MHIREVFIQGKYAEDAALCEDGYVVTPHFAAVVDGSTSKRSLQVGQKSGGRRAMETVKTALTTLPPEVAMTETVELLTEALRRITPPEAATDATFRCTCSVVIFSRYRREVWMVGDCQCRFADETRTNGKLVDSILTEARCDALRYLLTRGHSVEELCRNDLGRALIMDALRDQTNFQNDRDAANPFRYTVLDGCRIDKARVPIHKVPENCHHLILASDGYPLLFDTLAETERYLQDVLAEDPLCIGRNAGTKCLVEGQSSFDDRTYLSLEI